MNKFLIQVISRHQDNLPKQEFLHAQEGYVNRHLVLEALMLVFPGEMLEDLEEAYFGEEQSLQYHLMMSESCWAFYAEEQDIIITKVT